MASWRPIHSNLCFFQLLIPGWIPVPFLESKLLFEIVTHVADIAMHPYFHPKSMTSAESSKLVVCLLSFSKKYFFPPLFDLSSSESTVWALSLTGEVWRRFGVSTTNVAGDYWKKIPCSPAVYISGKSCTQYFCYSIRRFGYRQEEEIIKKVGGISRCYLPMDNFWLCRSGYASGLPKE